METKRLIRIAALVVLLISSTVVMAQNPPHPNSGGTPTTGTNTTVGGQQGGAPVGSGNLILFVLALAYAGRKINQRKEEAATEG